MLAEPRQIHHEGVFELAVDVLLYALEIVVLRALGELAAEDLFPVRPPLDLLHPLAGDQRTRPRGRERRQFRLQDNSVSVHHYCFPCIKSVSWIHGKTSKTDRR